jgi:hypothetical protein
MLDLVVLGLVCLVAPWLAKMSGYETPRKPFDLVGIAGIFFLLGTSLSMVVDHVAWLRVLGSFTLGLPYAVGVLLLTLGARPVGHHGSAPRARSHPGQTHHLTVLAHARGREPGPECPGGPGW